MRGTYLPSQTGLGLATHLSAQSRRCAHLVRPWRVRPQPPQTDRTPTMTDHATIAGTTRPQAAPSTRPAHPPSTDVRPRRRARTDLFDPHAGHAARTPPADLLLPEQV